MPAPAVSPPSMNASEPDPAHVDAGSAGRLGVAADRVDVAAELGAAQQEVQAITNASTIGTTHGTPADVTASDAAVGVADRTSDDAGGRHDRDLRQRSAQTGGATRPLRPPAPVARSR